MSCTVFKSPGSCSSDFDCSGYIHPYSFEMQELTRQCASKDYLYSAGSFFEIDESINCECHLVEGNDFINSIFGIEKGICRNKDVNWK